MILLSLPPAPDLIVIERSSRVDGILVTYRLPSLERVSAVPLTYLSIKDDLFDNLFKVTLTEDKGTMITHAYWPFGGHTWSIDKLGGGGYTKIPRPFPWFIVDVVPKGDSYQVLLSQDYSRYAAGVFRDDKWVQSLPETWKAEPVPPAQFAYAQAAMQAYPRLGPIEHDLVEMGQPRANQWWRVFGETGGAMQGTIHVPSGDMLLQLHQTATDGACFVRRPRRGQSELFFLPGVPIAQQLRIRGAYSVVRYKDLVYLLTRDGQPARSVPGSLIVDVAGE